jgi:hypothetical protein
VVLELFVPWALVVLALFLIARSSREPPEPEDEAGGPEQD